MNPSEKLPTTTVDRDNVSLLSLKQIVSQSIHPMQIIQPTRYTSATVNTATLWLRLGLGIAMIPHGYDKLTHFADYQNSFMSFMGLSMSSSLILAIGAEFFCSVLLMIGLLTRLVLIPLIITALVIVFLAHDGDIVGDGSAGFALLIGYITSLLLGPGAFSLDALLFKHRP
jgi:putative oxidoreductase